MEGNFMHTVSWPVRCAQGLYANFTGRSTDASRGHGSRDACRAFLRHRRCSRRHVLTSMLLVFIVPFLYFQLTFPVRYMFKNTDVHSSCHIPSPDPFDPSILKFVWKPDPLVCDSTPSLIFVDTSGLIQFNSSSIHVFADVSALHCEYRILERYIDDDHVTFQQAVQFTPPFHVNSDFFTVKCRNTKGQVMFDRLLTSIVNTTERTGKEIKAESRDHMSVIFFGLDSVSRSAAIRKLPKTFRYLTEHLGAYDFKGYMKVGENTLPNITPLLTGRRIWTNEVPITDYKTDNFDALPFLWKNVTNNGYSTLFAEDVPEFAAFNYLTKGFKHPPTDHYMRPFWLSQAHNKVKDSLDKVFLYLEGQKLNVRKSSALCYGNKPKYQIQVDYMKQFLSTYRGKRKFAFSFITELTHEVPNFLEYGDQDFLELFTWMEESGHLKDTVLVFFSDHGARIDSIRNTFVGRIEDRMPLLTIAIPKYLKTEYPELDNNMQINTKRLATPFDVHQTMVDVLNNNFGNPSVSYVGDSLRSISLFQSLPADRSCADAWIPENYCACYKSTPVNTSTNDIVRQAAAQMVDDLNNMVLSQQHKCSKLAMLNIQEAHSIEFGLKHDGTENKGISLFQFFKPEVSANMRYFIIIQTTPGNGVFEATYDFRSRDGLRRVGDIVRANKYGNQPHCISQKQIRPYCFCKDLLD